MVVKPSPLLVGREFVRQYTLLNPGPEHATQVLWKELFLYIMLGIGFKRKASRCRHMDRKKSRKVNMQNFTNCHTKIRHVDAHATLNDGVVVQMGLLSNNSQALGSFMQTFIPCS